MRYNEPNISAADNLTQTQTTEPSESESRFKLNIHNHPDSLDNLRNQWDDLARRANAPLCMSFMWIEKWWKHLGRHKKRMLHILTVSEGNKLVAIAPFFKGYSALAGKIAYRRIQLVGSGGKANEQFGFTDDYGISDNLDLIVDPDYAEPVSKLISNWCKVALTEVDTITFHQVADQSFIKKHLYPNLKDTGTDIDLIHTDTRPVIHLDQVSTLKKYITKQKSSARRRLRQTLRAMKPDGEISIRELHTNEELESAMDVIIKLHQERWTSQGYPGMFHDQRFTNFFKDLVRTAHANNQLWFKHTTDEEGISSSRLLFLFNRRYYDYLSGIDITCPSSKYRPGFALLLDVIEESINSDAIDSIDLLRGEERYKFDFTDSTVKNWKIVLHKNGHNSLPNRLTKEFIHATSYVYNHLDTESKLLGQHYRNEGFPRMFYTYAQQRLERLREKIKDE